MTTIALFMHVAAEARGLKWWLWLALVIDCIVLTPGAYVGALYLLQDLGLSS